MNTLKNVLDFVVMNNMLMYVHNVHEYGQDCFYHSSQLLQNNHGDRFILEECAHVSNCPPSRVPPEPPEPPDASTPVNGRAQWYLGFLHVMSGMANLIMTIPLQLKHNVGQWATKVRANKLL